MKKIGIIGAGQAGQRIAVALSNFEDVIVSGIVDPVNGIDVLNNKSSPWKIPNVKFFKSDDEMLSEKYDAIVLAADPMNVSYEPLGAHRKPYILVKNKVTCPILWERPLGYKPEHPKEVFNTVNSASQSIISFSRYGLPTKVAKGLMSTGSLGEITDFDFFLTLNCGLKNKKWRHSGKEGTTQPVHFLDNAFEQIETMGLGRISEISATRKDIKRGGCTFDEKWELNVTLDNGVSGRIIGLQYVGDSEFLYGLRRFQITGTEGALLSSLGRTIFIDKSGGQNIVSLASYGIDPRIVKATNKLEQFFKDIDKYPAHVHCRGEAQALAECLRTWVDSLYSKDKSAVFNLTTIDDATRYLSLADAALKSAMSKSCISTSHLY